MRDAYDVIVIGLGAMGASTAMHLAQRGVAVLGIDAHQPPHTLGSHHGESRIIRKAYYEHPGYVPMLARAFESWRELERRTGRSLLKITGGLMIGAPDGELVSGVLASARTHDLPHELLSAAAMQSRYPSYRLDPSMVAVWEPEAGILFPERCVATMLDLAREQGATIRCNEPVREWQEIAAGVRVTTSTGTYTAHAIVLCAGAGLTKLHPPIARSLQIERQVVAHFAPSASAAAKMTPDRFPIFAFEQLDGGFFYGFADLGNGVKVARHHGGASTRVEPLDRTVNAADIDEIREFCAKHLPDASGTLLASATCLYTNTPDFHFVLDRIPASDRVFVASPCSGHGFKFASVVGEIMADLVQGRSAGFDLSLFNAQRIT